MTMTTTSRCNHTRPPAPWRRVAGTAAALLALAAPQVSAQWSVTPYVWGAGIHADVTVNGSQVVDQDIAFADLIDDVDLAAMVRVEARYGAWGGVFDVFYVGMSARGSEVELPGGPTGSVDADIGMAVIDATGSWSPARDGSGFALLAGTRIVGERVTVTLRVPTSPATTLTQETEEKDLLVDGVVGLRFRRQMASRWSLEARGDVGAGGTKLSWSARTEVAYAFGTARRYAVNAGYRHLDIQFKDEGDVQAGMALSGLHTGFRIAF